MFRRNPTRIELKLDDLREYEDLKKELLEEKNKTSSDTSISTNSHSNTNKTKEQLLHERIGFKKS